MGVNATDVLASLRQLANLVLPVVGVVFPLLLLALAAEVDGIVRLSAEALAYVVYVACALAYGREVLVAGGWACVAFGAFLIARNAYRATTRGGAQPDEDVPRPRWG